MSKQIRQSDQPIKWLTNARIKKSTNRSVGAISDQIVNWKYKITSKRNVNTQTL